MSRKSFDYGHQNAGHASGGIVDFDVMHNLFHGGREGAENVVRGLVDAAQIAETGRTQDDVDDFPEAEEPNPYERDDGGADDPTIKWNPNDLGDLVDPQNDTYEEEGTHGLPLIAKAAAKGYMAARSNPKTGPLVKAGEQVVKEKSKELVGQAIAKGKEKWGARSEGELKGKGGSGLASPASESDDPLA
jgi:hypothetical protein